MLSKKNKKIWTGIIVVATLALILTSLLPVLYSLLR